MILQLQQSAGNAAVARQLLLRDGPAVKAKGIEKQFDDAIKNKFWNLLASLLDGNRDAGAKKLATLGIDQLRILDDAARRIGLADQWLRTEVKTKLKAKGLTDKQAEPGMAYGKVEAKETVKENGDLTPGRRSASAIASRSSSRPTRPPSRPTRSRSSRRSGSSTTPATTPARTARSA